MRLAVEIRGYGYAGDLVFEVPGSQHTEHLLQAVQRVGVRLAVNSGGLSAGAGIGFYPGLHPFDGDFNSHNGVYAGNLLDKGNGNYRAVSGYGNGTYTPAQMVTNLTNAYVEKSALIESIDVWVACASGFNVSSAWKSDSKWKKCATLAINGGAVYDTIATYTADQEFPIYAVRIVISSFSGASVPTIGNVQLFYEGNDPSDFVQIVEHNSNALVKSRVSSRKYYSGSSVALTTGWTYLAEFTLANQNTATIKFLGYLRVSVNQACTLQAFIRRSETDNIESPWVVYTFGAAASHIYIPIVVPTQQSAANGNLKTFPIGLTLSSGTGTIEAYGIDVLVDDGYIKS